VQPIGTTARNPLPFHPFRFAAPSSPVRAALARSE
jgi:hypothetical protein